MSDRSPYDYSDKELIEGSLKNDRHLQEMLYRKYADAMFTVACNYSQSYDEAADILQDGFIKVFRKLKDHDEMRSLGGWIKRIVINTAIEHYRKNKRHVEVLEEYYNEESVPENLFDNVNEVDVIRYVNKLPSKAQMVLKLFTLEGYGHQEIATALDISVGTSKSQLNRAKVLLKEMLSTNNG
jgi:RNA polymerase sigma-70 factor (ECF subfamily)